jgi:hypothetical protein
MSLNLSPARTTLLSGAGSRGLLGVGSAGSAPKITHSPGNLIVAFAVTRVRGPFRVRMLGAGHGVWPPSSSRCS